MVLVFEKEVVRVICAYALQVGRSECEKDQFYNDIANEWDLQSPGEVVLGLWDFNGHVKTDRWFSGRALVSIESKKNMLREEDHSSF